MSKPSGVLVSEDEKKRQFAFIKTIREENEARFQKTGKRYKYFVRTYGCQQNENDSEKLSGMLSAMGYEPSADERAADLIIFNTCAVREHAEMKVFGNVGALKPLKEKNPDLLVALCGCMMQQEHIAKEIRQKYRHVDLVFGTHALLRFPEILFEARRKQGRVFDIEGESGHIAEGLPMRRDQKVTAWVSVMYGCNNFCSYCVVPYVRGRERSRRPEKVLEEISGLLESGYKDITLLGQNVNSYGRDLAENVDFSDLLQMASALPGKFRLRFMTSHPKDANEKLIDTIKNSDKIAKQLHLPFQAGSDRILRLMNRGYTKEKYLDLICMAKEKIPGIQLSSDVIVGFPTETEKDFEETLDVLQKVEFDSLFSFIYSRRKGTPAEKMEGQISQDVKKARFAKLLALQNEASRRKNDALLGETLEVLVCGVSENDPNMLSARSDGGKLILIPGEKELIGQFVPVEITSSRTWSMFGKVVDLK